MLIEIKPPHFTNADLRAITQSCSNRNHPISALVSLLRSVRKWRFEDVQGNSPIALNLRQMATRIDTEISLTLWVLLLEMNVVEGHYLDLNKLAEKCHGQSKNL